jgi:hypothetical protein
LDFTDMATVFWSWQSDLPRETTRDFIEQAIEAAISVASDGLHISPSDRPEIDEGVKGSPGMAEIAATLFGKIATATLFIADVTPLYRMPTGKALPNPNVSTELGYAAHALKWANLLAVMNTAGGWKVEDLPFDLKHRSGTITYELPEGAPDDVRKMVRTALVQDLADGISLILKQRFTTDILTTPDETPEQLEAWRQWVHDAWTVKAQLPSHRGGEATKACVTADPKLYVRVIPNSRGHLRRDQALAALHSCNLYGMEGGASSGDFGSTRDGVTSYGFFKRDADYIVPSLVEWHSSNGELRFFLTAFTHNLTREVAVSRWADFLTRARSFYAAAEVAGPYAIELGVAGADELTMLTSNFGGPQGLVRDASSKHIVYALSRDMLEPIIREAEAELSDAFGLSSAVDEVERALSDYLR